ncbi:hypothetical protein JTB14_026826 [Gonioctena quinquepunctata]|nr:hypothetical protein JTB14_026826 [Gonioctena quinquepunctata]
MEDQSTDQATFSKQIYSQLGNTNPTYNGRGSIDILLEVDEYGKSILEGLKKIESDLIGQETEFGWILSGQIQRSNRTNSSDKSTIAHVDKVRKNVSTDAHSRPGDLTCEEVYKESTTKHEDVRDSVGLPFGNAAENPQTLGLRAISRSRQPKNKLYDNQEQHQQYSHESPKLGHMKKVLSTQINQGQSYIPHQAAIQEESTTTKVRADAATVILEDLPVDVLSGCKLGTHKKIHMKVYHSYAITHDSHGEGGPVIQEKKLQKSH